MSQKLKRFISDLRQISRSVSHVPSLSKNSIPLDIKKSSFFIFDDQVNPRVTEGNLETNRYWKSYWIQGELRPSFEISSDEKLQIPVDLQIDFDSVLFLRYSALSYHPAENLYFELSLSSNDKTSSVIVLPVCGLHAKRYEEVQISLSAFWGQWNNGIQCQFISSIKGNIVIHDLCIARQEELERAKASSFSEIRVRNEIAHFSQAYKHHVYEEELEKAGDFTADSKRTVYPLIGVPHPVNKSREYVAYPSRDNESAFFYGFRMLAKNLDTDQPKFLERLKQKVQEKGHVSVLSLCCGAARYEANYAAELGSACDWTLLDINEDLLQTAAAHFSPDIPVTLIQANANELSYIGRTWDVIICISALHHIVELEKFILFCHESLEDGGEFWSIGECISRNGNRLWPEAYRVANGLFSVLPEKYRYNAHTKSIDENLPDNDYSVGCFEGIRSQEIQEVIHRWFKPDDVYAANCFLWRLVNLAYTDNYDISKEEDQEIINNFVRAEIDFYRKGGKPTELHGIYIKKEFG